MTKVSEDEFLWMQNNFALDDRDMPSDFISSNDMLRILCGLYSFRGLDYHFSESEGQSFVEDCYLSLTARDSNKKQFNRLINQTLYLLHEAYNLEYYLLYANILEIIENYKIVVHWYNHDYITEQVNSLLDELNINK